MAGRPRKPTYLKVMAGNPGKRALPEEREVASAPAEKPAWVTVDPVASPVWDEMASSRVEMGLLTSITAESFGQLCRLLGEQRRNANALTPAQLTHMRYLMGAFGLDPSALAKLGLTTGKPKPANAFSAISG